MLWYLIARMLYCYGTLTLECFTKYDADICICKNLWQLQYISLCVVLVSTYHWPRKYMVIWSMKYVWFQILALKYYATPIMFSNRELLKILRQWNVLLAHVWLVWLLGAWMFSSSAPDVRCKIHASVGVWNITNISGCFFDKMFNLN